MQADPCIALSLCCTHNAQMRHCVLRAMSIPPFTRVMAAYSGSKQGRKVIGRFLGDEGNSIISALKKASAIDVGVDQVSEQAEMHHR